MKHLPTIVQMAGFLSLNASAYAWNVVLGLAVTGASLLMVGQSMESEV